MASRMSRRFTKVLFLAIVVAGVVVSAAAALRFTDDSYNTPEGVVGASYSHTYAGDGGCGPALPYQYKILNGALPPGLSLSSSGLISGRPSRSGTYSFWVELSDEDPPSQGWCFPAKAERQFTVNILPGLSIETKSLQDKPGTIGFPYSVPLSAMLLTSSDPPAGTAATGLAWSVLSGALPPGLSVVDGVITGTPTTAGSFQFVVQAAIDPTRTDTETLQIEVTAPLVITPPADTFSAVPAKPISEVGVPFSAKLAAAGGTGVYTWSLSEGVLPLGIALAADGSLIGKPKVAGAFAFTVALADSAGRTATQSLNLAVAARLAIKTQRVRKGKVGKLYRAKLRTRGGVLPTKWKATKGRFPRGIRLDRKLGVIAGTPRKPGRYRVTFEATDAFKVKSKKTLFIFVLAK